MILNIIIIFVLLVVVVVVVVAAAVVVVVAAAAVVVVILMMIIITVITAVEDLGRWYRKSKLVGIVGIGVTEEGKSPIGVVGFELQIPLRDSTRVID